MLRRSEPRGERRVLTDVLCSRSAGGNGGDGQSKVSGARGEHCPDARDLTGSGSERTDCSTSCVSLLLSTLVPSRVTRMRWCTAMTLTFPRKKWGSRRGHNYSRGG